MKEVYYENHSESWTDMKTVDSLSAGKSPYGVHHLAGNVWEWVSDWYAKDYYKQNVVKNPSGASSDEYRSIKGGAWDNSASGIRSAHRYNYRPENRVSDVGCRCAK